MGAMNRAFSGVDSLGSRNLGRCPRLRLNTAPLALNTLEVLLLHGHKCADWNSGAAARSAIAPYQFGVGSRVRYCTVTSVPTGISEKNFRAVSSGNRMQPCDAG